MVYGFSKAGWFYTMSCDVVLRQGNVESIHTASCSRALGLLFTHAVYLWAVVDLIVLCRIYTYRSSSLIRQQFYAAECLISPSE